MSIGSFVFGFSLGIGAGALAMKFYMDKKADADIIVDVDWDEIKKKREDEDKLEETLKQASEAVDEEFAEDEEAMTTNYNKIASEYNEKSKVTLNGTIKVDMDEFGMNDEYSVSSLILTTDNVLIDESTGDVEENLAKAIRDVLDSFIRNDEESELFLMNGLVKSYYVIEKVDEPSSEYLEDEGS